MGSCRSCINGNTVELSIRSIDSVLDRNDKKNKEKAKKSLNGSSELQANTHTFGQDDKPEGEKVSKSVDSIDEKNVIVILSSVSLEISSFGGEEYVRPKGSEGDPGYIFKGKSLEEVKDNIDKRDLAHSEKEFDFNSSLSEYLKKREEFYEYASHSSLKQAEFEKNTQQFNFVKEQFHNSLPNDTPDYSREPSIKERASRSGRHSAFYRMRTSKSEVPIKSILKRSKTTKTYNSKSSKRVRFDIHHKFRNSSKNEVNFFLSYFPLFDFDFSISDFLCEYLFTAEAANSKTFSRGKP